VWRSAWSETPARFGPAWYRWRSIVKRTPRREIRFPPAQFPMAANWGVPCSSAMTLARTSR
jgi:hypothetical protein